MTANRALVIFLRIYAAVAGSAVIAVFMPRAAMEYIHQAMGLGPLPQGPVFEYLARSISALYALHGAFVLLLSSDVRRFQTIIRFFGIAYIVLGLILLGIDLHVGLPWIWTLVEGPTVMAIGATILALQRSPTWPTR